MLSDGNGSALREALLRLANLPVPDGLIISKQVQDLLRQTPGELDQGRATQLVLVDGWRTRS